MFTNKIYCFSRRNMVLREEERIDKFREDIMIKMGMTKDQISSVYRARDALYEAHNQAMYAIGMRCELRRLFGDTGRVRGSVLFCQMVQKLSLDHEKAVSDSIYQMELFYSKGKRIQFLFIQILRNMFLIDEPNFEDCFESPTQFWRYIVSCLRIAKELFSPMEEIWSITGVEHGDCKAQVRESFVIPEPMKRKRDQDNGVWKFLKYQRSWEEVIAQRSVTNGEDELWQTVKEEEVKAGTNRSYFWIDIWVTGDVNPEINRDLVEGMIVNGQVSTMMLMCIINVINNIRSVVATMTHHQKKASILLPLLAELKNAVEESIHCLSEFSPDWLENEHTVALQYINSFYMNSKEVKTFQNIYRHLNCTRC